MQGRIAFSLIFCLAVVPFTQAGPPTWVKLTDSAGFSPRDSCGEFVYRDRLWILGGWMDSYKDPPRDVWSSPDGVVWTKATQQAPWKHSDFPMTVVFKDR